MNPHTGSLDPNPSEDSDTSLRQQLAQWQARCQQMETALAQTEAELKQYRQQVEHLAQNSAGETATLIASLQSALNPIVTAAGTWRDDNPIFEEAQMADSVCIPVACLNTTSVRQDILDCQSTEAALRESQQRLYTIIGNLPGVVYRWVFDAAGKISIPYVSTGLLELLGISAEERMAHPESLFDAVHPEDLAPLQKALATSRKTLAPLNHQYRLRTPSGQWKWLRAIARVHATDTGEIVFDGLNLDITAHKFAEEALRESEAMNRALISALPDLLFRIARDGTFLDCIPAADIAMDVPLYEFLDKKVTDLLPAAVAVEFINAIELALQTGNTQLLEFQMPVQGNSFDYEARIAASGKARNEVLAIVRDITDRKQAERLLQVQIQRTDVILQTALDGFCILNLSRHFLEVNPAFCVLVGYSRQELLGIHVSVLEAVESPLACPKYIKTLIQTGSARFELVLRHKNGKTVSAEVSITFAEINQERFFFAFVRDISERKQAEEELQRQAQIISQIHDSVISTDLEGYITSWNSGAERLFEYSKAEAIGQNISCLYPLEHREAVRERVFYPALEKGSHEIELLKLNKSGETLWVHLSLSLQKNLAGENIGMIGYSINISERKRAEEALRESQERFRQLAENLSDVFWMMNADKTQFLYVSPAYEQIWGRTCESLYEQPSSFVDAIHPDDRQSIITLCKNQNQDNFDQEYRVIQPDGSVRWIRTRAFPVCNEQGEVYRIVGISQDITLAKQATEERDRFFSLSLDILGVAGFDGYFKRVNPAISTILGYTPEEFLAIRFLEIIHPDEYDVTVAELKKLRNGNPTFYFENRYRCKDGAYKWISWTAFPVLEEQLIYIVARDMTEQKLTEAALTENHEKYKLLFESFPIGISITDEVGNIIDTNAASEKMLGMPRKEQIERNCESPEWYRIHADGTPMPLHEFPCVKALRENKVFENVEFGLVKDNQKITWLSVTTAPIPLEGYGVAIAYTDITERKLATEALRRSEQKFRTLAEHIPDIIARFDRQLRHLYANPAAERASGLSPQGLIGKTNRELGFPETIVSAWEKAMKQVFETGSEAVIEFEFATAHTIKYYEARIVPEFSIDGERHPDGEVQSTLCITRDMTERKQMENSLKIAQARLEHLLTASPAVIYSCTLSEDYGATFISKNIKTQLGYEARDFIENSSFWIERIHPEDATRVLAQMQRVSERGQGTFEYRFQHQDGTYRWMYEQTQVVRDESGNPLEVVGFWIDITERKQAEAQLIRISQAVESASDAVNIVDITTQHIYQNPAFQELFGYTIKELVAFGGASILFCDKAVAKQVFETISQGGFWSGEVKMQSRQGKILDILLRAYAIKDNSGQMIGLVGIHTDISERKRTLEALQEREMRFRTLTETVTAAIFISQGTQLRYVNSAAEELTGYTREELLAGGTELIHPKFREFFINRIGEGFSLPYLRQQGQQLASRYELQLLTKTGQERWVNLSVALMEFDGQIAALSAAFDITERKQAEQSLKYRLVLEQLISDISTHFLNLPPAEIDKGINEALYALGEFINVERTYVFLFNESGTEMSNTHEWCAPGIEPYIHKLQNVPVSTFPWLVEILRRGEVIQISDLAELPPEARAEKAECELAGIQSMVNVSLVAGGEVVGFIGGDSVPAGKAWTEDHITLLRIVGEIIVTAMERRRAQEEKTQLIASLEERAADLARSNAELEQFAYVASHDLQEPLRAVTGYTQLLARRYSGQLDTKADEYIAFAVDGATRMQKLIQDLLLFSRVGRRAKAYRPVELESVLNTAVANLQVAIAETSATITHSELPTVQGDSTQLVQLLQNIISNAIKYRSLEPPIIHISAERQDEQWQLSICDNGIGIDLKYAERIFLVFQRLHTREEYPGTGIGLAICQKIVERHGGRIWVDSRLAEGSTFYFTIPDGKELHEEHDSHQ
ncbi:PAS domain S-box protein [Microcoleus sp. FACHB-672]|uniref:PAS domain S-box protein n=1 Tax=Microcoleus sp. FACHB-672 TaxID=2692825 RepID=UPI001684221E|nr:PAS domain S-box protein [Microcoleus sp. FACHB-672]MBD2040911.1 PAS domain S-box protein [Microcoleus sp. FACHB-672]